MSREDGVVSDQSELVEYQLAELSNQAEEQLGVSQLSLQTCINQKRWPGGALQLFTYSIGAGSPC